MASCSNSALRSLSRASRSIWSSDPGRPPKDGAPSCGTIHRTSRPWIYSLLCVPKTSSVLIARPNRLNVSGDDRALLAPPGPVRLTVQVKERTCGRERCAPTSIDCAAAEGARSRSTREWGSLVLGHAISMVSSGYDFRKGQGGDHALLP